ncbi:hypothetical protein CLV92_104132 [Kineococcus xinjiangensis]|uniref:Uncharacterized protein n=1 Tax=Kineococcus xinjiangensis TaxID=512762 RepID=A0A2S6IST1_9ACTN|nr:hypothetical protein [Kineococcus xinjiangensis]PPK97312.1 hypothetical protein CLV92_104132 [Kineococcus xinjiangensis]
MRRAGRRPTDGPKPPMSPGARRALAVPYLLAVAVCAAVAAQAALTGRTLVAAAALLVAAVCSELLAMLLLRDRDRRRAANSQGRAGTGALPALG